MIRLTKSSDVAMDYRFSGRRAWRNTGGTWKGAIARAGERDATWPGGGHAGCHGICKTPFVTRSHKNPSNAALDWQPCATGTPCLPVVGNYALQNRDTTSPTLRPLPTLLSLLGTREPALHSLQTITRTSCSIDPWCFFRSILQCLLSDFKGKMAIENLINIKKRIMLI